MGFFALSIGNAYRALLSTAIPEMVVPITLDINYSTDECPNNEPVSDTNRTAPAIKLYNWDEYTQVNNYKEVK